MNFKRDEAQKIRQGKKTMVRKMVRDGEKVCRFEVGHAYSIQAGGKSVGHLTVSAVVKQRLGAVTLQDVRAEGFITTAEFEDWWRERYGAWTPDAEVWAITFTLGDTTDTPRLLAAHLGGRGGDYTTNPALAAAGEGEALTADEQTEMSAEARDRDHLRAGEPMLQALAVIEGGIKAATAAANTEVERDALRAFGQQFQRTQRRLAA